MKYILNPFKISNYVLIIDYIRYSNALNEPFALLSMENVLCENT